VEVKQVAVVEAGPFGPVNQQLQAPEVERSVARVIGFP
jgi:hypothetical protein